MKGTKMNCTTIFMLPGIGLYRRDLLQYGFLSAYIGDASQEWNYENALYLLFRPDDLSAFQEFLEQEKSMEDSLLIDEYDVEGGYVVLVYSYPEIYLKDYQLFKEGKYSQFSDQFKSLSPTEVFSTNEVGDRVSEPSLTYHIYNKTDKIREYWEDKTGVELTDKNEMWSIPDLKKETLDINNL